jgi:hypothetical protein
MVLRSIVFFSEILIFELVFKLENGGDKNSQRTVSLSGMAQSIGGMHTAGFDG